MLWLTYCGTTAIACTVVAWLVVDRAYFVRRETICALAISALAALLGVAVRVMPPLAVFPLLSRLAYASLASLVVLVAGLWLVLGHAEIVRFGLRWRAPRASAASSGC